MPFQRQTKNKKNKLLPGPDRSNFLSIDFFSPWPGKKQEIETKLNLFPKPIFQWDGILLISRKNDIRPHVHI